MRPTPARPTVALVAACVVTWGCGSGNTSSSGDSTQATANNTQAAEVGTGPDGAEVNGLYTSVTICVPGTTSCQTIAGVQVDTGSVGLRLLASAVTLPLPHLVDGNGNALANCALFADLSFVWGPLAHADVNLAGETASSIPVQLIGSSDFAGAPDSCSQGGTAADTVTTLGATGLLGLGVFRQDCGPACSGAALTPPPLYYACPATGCTPAFVSIAAQLQNPVWLFPHDNNGVIVSLPAVPGDGSPDVSGSLVFGIGTLANNSPAGVQVYTTNDLGNISTVFQGTTFSSSYLDTGSTALGLSDPSTLGLPTCADGNSDFYCPSTPTHYTATLRGNNGATNDVSFTVANADQLFRSVNTVFNDVAGPGGGDFDWGLPFFLGRRVFVGIEGQASPVGVGPYWAY